MVYNGYINHLFEGFWVHFDGRGARRWRRYKCKLNKTSFLFILSSILASLY
jgi:hypothetical protein